MIAALLLTVLVRPGDTMSGIAASHHVSLAAVEQANPRVGNPNLIYAGQTLNLPGGTGGNAESTASPSPSSTFFTPTPAPVQTEPVFSGDDSGDLSDVPGVPQAFAACVAFRESTDLENPAADGNAYGIIPASGVDVAGDSIAQQKQAFSELYAQDGTAPWAPSDGC
jgi:LysM domain